MAKSKTKYKKYTGRSSYAMVYSPDEYLGKKFWKMNFHADDETFDQLRADGIQNKIKDSPVENCDGPFMTFKRDCQKDFSGQIQKFAPPEIFDKDGRRIVWYEEDGENFVRVGDPVLIGNGSVVEIELVIYPTKSFGKGSRLNKIRIIDLIEYNPDEDDDDDAREIEDDDEVETKVKTTSEVDLDDEIPFEKKKPKKSSKISW